MPHYVYYFFSPVHRRGEINGKILEGGNFIVTPIHYVDSEISFENISTGGATGTVISACRKVS